MSRHFKLTATLQARAVERREDREEEEEEEDRALRLVSSEPSSSSYTTITKTTTLIGCPIISDETRKRREIKLERKRRRIERNQIDKSPSRTNNNNNSNNMIYASCHHQTCRQCSTDTSRSKMIRSRRRANLTIKMFISLVAIQFFLAIPVITLITASKLTAVASTLSSKTNQPESHETVPLSALANVRYPRSLYFDGQQSQQHHRHHHFGTEQEHEGKYSRFEKSAMRYYDFFLYLSLSGFISLTYRIIGSYQNFPRIS